MLPSYDKSLNILRTSRPPSLLFLSLINCCLKFAIASILLISWIFLDPCGKIKSGNNPDIASVNGSTFVVPAILSPIWSEIALWTLESFNRFRDSLIGIGLYSKPSYRIPFILAISITRPNIALSSWAIGIAAISSSLVAASVSIGLATNRITFTIASALGNLLIAPRSLAKSFLVAFCAFCKSATLSPTKTWVVKIASASTTKDSKRINENLESIVISVWAGFKANPLRPLWRSIKLSIVCPKWFCNLVTTIDARMLLGIESSATASLKLISLTLLSPWVLALFSKSSSTNKRSILLAPNWSASPSLNSITTFISSRSAILVSSSASIALSSGFSANRLLNTAISVASCDSFCKVVFNCESVKIFGGSGSSAPSSPSWYRVYESSSFLAWVWTEPIVESKPIAFWDKYLSLSNSSLNPLSSSYCFIIARISKIALRDIWIIRPIRFDILLAKLATAFLSLVSSNAASTFSIWASSKIASISSVASDIQ